MEKFEKEIATALRKAIAKEEPLLKCRGTLEDYWTVYADHKRGDGDWSRSIATDLYANYGFEYCVLLGVVHQALKPQKAENLY